MNPLEKPDDNVLDVPGSVLANDPGPGEEVGLRRPRGFGEVRRHGPVGVEVFHKVLRTEKKFRWPGDGVGGAVTGTALGSSHGGSGVRGTR